ncbi:hypothetical protein JYU34_011923 [Plutella xylostella]|uniref:CRAL-TRIO domain-containing protein n=1 Tax=Plutella xylostella TaxID=51655 RepID=A0ABQ7QEP4_PLUXY|nr:hypothetical protein JYU34_011923 [Plutella xylostella]
MCLAIILLVSVLVSTCLVIPRTMETIPHHPLIQVTQEDLAKAREFYGISDVKRIRESLDAVDDWCQKQSHLVQKNLNRNILERLFLMSRGSVEGTKKRIDGLFTARGMMPELSLNRTVEEFDRFWDGINYVPLPKLCQSDSSRVMVTQLLTDNIDDFNLLTYFRYCFLVGEYRLHFDYSLSERYIIDLKNFSLSHLSKVSPMTVKKSEVLATEGFGTKIKGIHILNAPPFVDKVVFLLKSALKEKVASRLHVHSTYADLHKHIPKEILPRDYDGDEQSVSKLAAQWKDELRTDAARKLIKELDNLRTDETKRQTGKFNEEYLGMPGSFRTLSVD